MLSFTRLQARCVQVRLHRHRSSWTTAVNTAELLVQPQQSFKDPFSIVSGEMSSLLKNIASLISSGHPMLNKVASYYFELEGKNVRPLIVLLLSKLLAQIPLEERNRIPIDKLDVINQPEFAGLSRRTSIAGMNADDSLSPLRILHGINPKIVLDPLSKPLGTLPDSDKLNGILPKQRRLAEIVEMIHTASLLHDDVIDFSDSRRGRPSGNIAFTNKMAILLGDFLLGRASVLISRLRNPEVIELMSTTIANLVEGEFMQLKNTVFQPGDNIDDKATPTPTGKVPTEINDYSVQIPTQISHEENVKAAFEYYKHKTYLKTASLMSKSSRSVAVLSGANDEIIESCYQFGRNLGLCFQVVDDMLDYTRSDKELGKPSQLDLKLGLATAPILYAWLETPELGLMISRKFSEPGDVEKLIKLVREHDGVLQTMQLAKEYRDLLLQNLQKLPPSDARSLLELLTNSVLTRNN